MEKITLEALLRIRAVRLRAIRVEVHRERVIDLTDVDVLIERIVPHVIRVQPEIASPHRHREGEG